MSLQTVDRATGEIVPAPRNLSPDLFIEFDRMDDDQIMAELRGAAVEQYVYSFRQGDQTIMGLSLAGVMAVAQNLGGITCGQPIWSSDEQEITCDISATDHKTGLTVWGTATEARVMQTKYGPKPDKFARGKALSKAQRNAIRKLIPEQIAVEMLKLFIAGGKPEPRQQRRALSQQASKGRAPAPEPEPPARGIVEVLADEVDADGVIRETPDGPGRADELLEWIASIEDRRDLADVKRAIIDAGLNDDPRVAAAYTDRWEHLTGKKAPRPEPAGAAQQTTIEG